VGLIVLGLWICGFATFGSSALHLAFGVKHLDLSHVLYEHRQELGLLHAVFCMIPAFRLLFSYMYSRNSHTGRCP
jgi:hypothetical protein